MVSYPPPRPPSRLLLNHGVAPLPAAARPGPAVQAFHQRFPGYAPTPLHDMAALATAYGVGRVLVKDETSRLGLPSFKVLGASWAIYRLLVGRLGREPAWTTLDDLATAVARDLGPLRLVAATDGNHGRAVAHVAKELRLSATILVPEGTADARIAGIAGEGAEVVVVPGTYDDAVSMSAGMADDRTLVISDTSWPGYEEVPRWVIEGYSTIFTEIEAQLSALGNGGDEPAGDIEVTGAGIEVADPLRVDLAVIPLGVGALGAAAGACLRAGREPDDGPLLVGVEPDSAACVAAAVEAGHVVEVPGPHRSIMAGLNCGLASVLALPTVIATFDALVAVHDDWCRRAVRSLADAGLDVGETGAASLAGLAALLDDDRGIVRVPPDATVLLLVTEGVTDPAGFEDIVGRPPR
ncbi:MAG TPA: pyridoxal-phosphate dependent enzyme [Acidimicrobiales bacterium]|nr:pyridoxal-phosphate dependent enzyme [Acidimicrobiales bacterium]